MRRTCFVLGLIVLALVWFGPLLTVWRASFAAHMLAHMGVVAIAAPLIAMGVAGSSVILFSRKRLAARSDQAQRNSPRPPPPISLSVSSQLPFFALPIFASLIELIVVWGWHAPAARAWVEKSSFATVLEQAIFLAAGLLLWLSCLRAGQSHALAHRAAGAFGLLLTTVHMTLLGALLALSPRPLYGIVEVTCFGLPLGAAQDQQLGAVIMLAIGAAVYLAGGVVLLARLLGRDPTGVGAG